MARVSNLALVLMLVFSRAAVGEVILVPREGSDLLLGRGYDSVTSDPRSDCIEFEKIETLSGTSGGAGVQEFSEIRTRNELRRTLGITAAGSFGFGAFSGSAKSSYHSEYSFDRQTYYLAARVSAIQQTEVISGIRLKEDAATLLATNPEAFHKACGDSFVSARTVGGEFVALIKLDTSSESEMSELRSSFKAAYSAASGNVEMNRRSSELYEQHNGTVEYSRIGGTGEFPEANPDSVKEYIRKFPTIVLGDNAEPFAITVTTKEYANLLDAAVLEPVNVTSSIEVMEELAVQFDMALDLRDDLAYILGNTEQFPSFDLEEISKYDRQITEALNKIRLNASLCRDFPTDTAKCAFSELGELSLSSVKLPSRRQAQYRLARTEVCGVEKYEEKAVIQSCRTPENGVEVVETRSFEMIVDVCGESDNSFQISTHPEHGTRNCNEYHEFLEKSNSAPLKGFDQSWRAGKITYGGRSKTSQCFSGGLRVPNAICLLEAERTQYIDAPNEVCGVLSELDYDRPVFKECRHISHGYSDD